MLLRGNSQEGSRDTHWAGYAGAILSALLVSLAFTPFNLSFLAFIGLIPLLWALDAKSTTTSPTRHLFGIGLVFGTLLIALYHTWMFSLAAWVPVGWIVLMWGSFSLYLGCFYGLMCVVYRTFYSKTGPLLFAVLWPITEWLRSLGPIGNPAASLGYSQVDNAHFLQLANAIGVYGVSFFVALISTLIYLAIKHDLKKSTPYDKRLAFIATSLLIVCSVSIWGYGHHHLTKQRPSPTHSVSILQANHPQTYKLNYTSSDTIRRDYLTMIKQVVASSNPDLIIAPETITPQLNLANTRFMQSLFHAVSTKNTVIVGTPTKVSASYYNSASAITQQGLVSTYHKQQLMPFGEYWPARSLLNRMGLSDWIPKTDYSPGPPDQPVTVNGVTLGIGICLESLYPWFFQQQVSQGATLLVALVNNAWFFDSKAAAQHIQMTRVRAVETGRYVIQSANTGISGIVSPTGQLTASSKLDTTTILSGRVALLTTQTLFTKYGNKLGLLLLISTLFLGAYLTHISRKT